MDLNSMFSFVDFLVVGCGLYVIYLYAEMKKTGKIRESMLLPKGLNLKKCKDTAGFIRMVAPKQLLLGIVAIACGVVGLIQDFTQAVPSFVYLLSLFVFFIYAVWYTVFMKKVIKKFW